jgi:hypothetical protein
MVFLVMHLVFTVQQKVSNYYFSCLRTKGDYMSIAVEPPFRINRKNLHIKKNDQLAGQAPLTM